MLYSHSYRNDQDFRPGDFVLSSVNSADMQKYGIKGSVKDFKAMVEKSRNYKVIMTGGNGYRRHSRVYNYNDFVKSVVPKQTTVFSTDYWWNEL